MNYGEFGRPEEGGIAVYAQRVRALREFVTLGVQTVESSSWEHGDGQALNADLGGEVIELGGGTGGMIAALKDPLQVETAIDCLLDLEAVSNAAPDLSDVLDGPGAWFDAAGGRDLEAVVSGSDLAVAAKALRLVCSRASKGVHGRDNFVHFFPQIAQLSYSRNRTTQESKMLYTDLVDALATYASTKERDNLISRQFLFLAFTDSIGYPDHGQLTYAWRHADKLMTGPQIARKNVEHMLQLEALSPGSCKKLTDTFQTYNFSRHSPEMFLDMLRQRQDNPSAPYVLGMVAKDAPFTQPPIGRKKNFYTRLRDRGVRYEEHECATVSSVGAVATAAVELNRIHGATIQDLSVYAHGNPDGIWLSAGAYPYDRPVIRRSNASVFKRFEPAMEDGARILLQSCLTAKEGEKDPPIARYIARAAGCQVVASTRTIAPRPFVGKDGRLNFTHYGFPLPSGRIKTLEPESGALAVRLPLKHELRLAVGLARKKRGKPRHCSAVRPSFGALVMGHERSS